MFDPLYIKAIGFHHYVIALVCLICAVTDARSGKIYNAVTYPAIAFGIIYNFLSADKGIIISSAAGCLTGLLPFGLAAARGLIGGGDVKLFAAIGAIGGFFFLLDSLFNCFILAGIYIVLSFLWRKLRKGDVEGVREGLGFRGTTAWGKQRLAFRKRQIRLGVFVFVGVLLSIIRVSLLGGIGQ
jgi:prepilin peptidase CpaA